MSTCQSVEVRYKIEGSKWQLKRNSSSAWNVCSSKNYTMFYNDPIRVQTGLYLDIPLHFEGQLRSISVSKRIVIIGHPVVTHEDKKYPVEIMMMNMSIVPYHIEAGDIVACLVICRLPIAEFKPWKNDVIN